MLYLHSGIINVERKVTVADLKRRCFIINKICSDDVELRDDTRPSED